ncbi:hypothetical protein [Xylocopilactobacillus apicola]|uniref:Uncharacterized protein n=1 Tax=Xylocopilactobacillus apicola TaxID=2932184 RepID=A0AAU9D292_9LACO|nr:hypothetical protein [Xylocopilactobacillus apicola]BDR57643.1 hypothetical protein XA3_00840 [Xylocopilactobacillus apicola]
MKYVYSDDRRKDQYWKECEKEHSPFIELRRTSSEYINVFYDVTNYQIDLDEISNNIKRFYTAYVEFFMIDPSVYKELYDQYYFFNLVVKIEHSEFLAEKLYDYLFSQLNK